MKSRTWIFPAAVLFVIYLSVPAVAAEVAHGKCVSYEEAKERIVIDEFDLSISKQDKHGRPTGKQLTFNTSKAVMGVTPVPGDILRIAYEKRGEQLMAVRVMNVTKTNIMKE